jgi:hypothetical protein
MTDFKPKPGSFLPFLQYAQRVKPLMQSAPPNSLAILEVLCRQVQQALPIFDLQTLSGMAPSPYVEALKSLRGEGYIEIVGESLEQTVRLTPSGAKAAKLVRPA